MTAGFAFLAVLLGILYFTISGFVIHRQAHKARVECFHEQTRSHWALARERLWGLVRAGELSLESETFVALNGITTFFLRRPDNYSEISGVVLKGLVPDEAFGSPDWLDEVSQWPKGMQDVVKELALGFGMMAASPYRLRWAQWTLKMSRVLARHAGRTTVGRVKEWLFRIPEIRVEHDLQRAEEQLERLSVRMAT